MFLLVFLLILCFFHDLAFSINILSFMSMFMLPVVIYIVYFHVFLHLLFPNILYIYWQLILCFTSHRPSPWCLSAVAGWPGEVQGVWRKDHGGAGPDLSPACSWDWGTAGGGTNSTVRRKKWKRELIENKIIKLYPQSSHIAPPHKFINTLFKTTKTNTLWPLK